MIDEAKSKLKDSPGAGVKRKGGPDSSGGQVSDCLEGKKNPCAPIISFRWNPLTNVLETVGPARTGIEAERHALE